jgi:hypothetical protein
MATDITFLKTCLAYYRLVPHVGAVGHVSQTVTVDQFESTVVTDVPLIAR